MPAPEKTMGRVPGMLEESNQFYYDAISITATTTGDSLYFQTPFSGSKSKLYTNMSQAGVLPVPKMLKVKAIRIVPGFKMAADDPGLLYDGSYLEFWVNDKVQLEGPLWMFPPGIGQMGFSNITAAATEFGTCMGLPDNRNIFTLKHTIDIGVQTPFYVKIIIPTALTGLTTMYVYTILEGETWRAVS